MRKFRNYALAFFGAIGMATVAASADDQALIVVNSDYKYTVDGPDIAIADALADRFSRSGYRTETVKNASIKSLRASFESFANSRKNGDKVVYVLLGHALHDDKESYFMPVGFRPVDKLTPPSRTALKMSSVLNTTKDHPGGSFVFLGSSKPFSEDENFDRYTRNLPSGFKPGYGDLSVPSGTLVVSGHARVLSPAILDVFLDPTISSADGIYLGRGLFKGQGLSSDFTSIRSDVTTFDLRKRLRNTPAILDNLNWQLAQAEDTVNAYQAYLDKFPQGKNTSKAQRRLSALQGGGASTTDLELSPKMIFDWQATRRANNVRAYREFIAAYPNSPFTQEARENIAKLLGTDLDRWKDARETEAKLQLGSSQWRFIEAKLTVFGLTASEVDGTVNRKTRQAIRTFQNEQGMEPSGYLQGESLIVLMTR